MLKIEGDRKKMLLRRIISWFGIVALSGPVLSAAVITNRSESIHRSGRRDTEHRNRGFHQWAHRFRPAIFIWGIKLNVGSSIYTTGTFNTGQSVTISGRVISTGDSYIGQKSSLDAFDSLGSIGLAQSVLVNGALASGSSVSIGGSTKVAGNISYNSSYWAG